ncbi:MAG: T9SS type A sorting domain-containing protein [Chitinophagales bacterium]|nr:T9SS type A sorting domain-containing protein [Chitinophagales bacterium]
MPADITNRINAYAITAGCFLLLNKHGDAQVIYTDIEPDIEIQFDEQTAIVDLDNDGTIDFAFLKSSDTYDWGISDRRLRQRIWAGPQLMTNEIAGDYFYYSAGGTITYLPYALDKTNFINDELNFYNWGYQLMAVAVANTEFPDDWAFHGGHWIVGETPKFLGVKFIGSDDCQHFGWIRCSVIDTVHTLIIYDYAFEKSCETGILAGDTSQYNEVKPQLSKLNLTIHPIPATDHIIIDYPTTTPTTLNIYNSSGANIYQNPHWTGEDIDVSNFPPAIYYLQLLQPEQVGYGCFVKE